MLDYFPYLLTVTYVLLEIAAIISAIEALLYSRTSQGAIEWSLFLIMFPLFGLHVYLIFGGRKFSGYLDARRSGNQPLQKLVQEATDQLPQSVLAEFRDDEQDHVVLTRLARMPFFAGNQCQLLIDGEDTFSAIFNRIDEAKEYILVQFFIIKDDELGRSFQQLLIKKARAGMRVSFLYDAIGSHSLPASYIFALQAAGVATANFDNRSFRLNFEISLLFADNKCVRDVEHMLENDFSQCQKMELKDIEQRPFWFKLLTKIARLFSPVL